ncbi:MAG: ATP-binding protein [Erysipelotrichaceae bacterium]|nr:ATP-binding protein [Erysipelotrichaceae bacterium]
MYISRDIENTIKETSRYFQVITIYGSRQVGKTTTVDYLFGDTFRFVSLDNTSDYDLANDNPRGFLEAYSWPLIIDEVQKAPKLLNEIKRIVDEQRRIWMRNNQKRELMYILTGSNQFDLQTQVSESLAGRTAVLEMAGLTQLEKKNVRGRVFRIDIPELLKKERECDLYQTREEIFQRIFEGGYPDIITGETPREMYFRSYVDTYIEKDIRKLISVDYESQFRKFMEIIALRTAQELNYENICSDAGISVPTCKRWISILETSGIIILLQPYMANMSKRIIKAPKLYFMDTGLCSYLCKWPNAQMLQDGVMSGAFFETYVISEIVKSYYNGGINPKDYLYYYRDIDKKEIDLLIVENGTIYPIEIKKCISPNKPTKNFNVLTKYNQPIMPGLVIDNTDKIRPINENVYSFPVSLLGI